MSKKTSPKKPSPKNPNIRKEHISAPSHEMKDMCHNFDKNKCDKKNMCQWNTTSLQCDSVCNGLIKTNCVDNKFCLWSNVLDSCAPKNK